MDCVLPAYSVREAADQRGRTYSPKEFCYQYRLELIVCTLEVIVENKVVKIGALADLEACLANASLDDLWRVRASSLESAGQDLQ